MIILLIDTITKVIHLILMIFFLCIVFNSIWNWLVSIIEDRKSISNNQVKTKSTQMD